MIILKDNFHNKEIGKYGEEKACLYLEMLGYEILSRNFISSNGEIDIVAKDKEEYVFVEVKTRLSTKYGEARESINISKRKHIINTSKYYIYVNSLENENIRYDVIEVYVNQKNFFINHIKNIFL